MRPTLEELQVFPWSEACIAFVFETMVEGLAFMGSEPTAKQLEELRALVADPSEQRGIFQWSMEGAARAMALLGPSDPIH